MATGDDLRRIALSLEGTREAPHFDRAAFKVARIYATLAADGKTANLIFSLDEQEFRCQLMPAVYAPVPGGWGRMGFTVIKLGPLSQEELSDALTTSWRMALPKKKPARRRR
jgi:hypothetical protein